MQQPETPDWVRDAVFYQIFPDRFARSLTVAKPRHLDEWGAPPTYHGYQGGDLVGVVEQLDYLQDLGVNAIYFTPIFQSASNHRYHTHDYEKVDPMLGGNAALRRLLDEAHARGIRVVLDGVFNHASRGFFQFHDILENGADSAYLDWFTSSGFPLNAYDPTSRRTTRPGGTCPPCPSSTPTRPAVREFLWGDRPELDRLRHRRLAARRAQRDRRRRVLAGVPPPGQGRRTPRPTSSARSGPRRQRWLQGRHVGRGDELPVHARLHRLLHRRERRRGRPAHDQPATRAGPSGAAAFRKAIERLLGLYPPHVTAVMLNLLDSHDMARFLTLARGDRSALRLATLFQMTYPGAPSIYYGDEIGMHGGHDPANRGAFPWHEPETWDTGPAPRVPAADRAPHAAGPPCAAARSRSCTPTDDVFAHARQLGDETVVVAFNTAPSTDGSTCASHGLVADGTVLERGLDPRGRARSRRG